ncbi:MAG TPA: sulfite exporter TauE/SafE family protein [Candidatus Angelobacter sp.]
MSILLFTILVWLVSVAVGFLGALTGLGGGTLIVPLLTLVFGVNIHYAMGASLISVIATSSGAAAAFLREGFTNLRLAMFLQVATTVGAIVGVLLVTHVSTTFIGVVFGVMLLYSAYVSGRLPPEDIATGPADKHSETFKLNGVYPAAQGHQPYKVQHVAGGFGVMFTAGVVSSLLGIGSGALKVLGMDRIMRIPFKVSTTTSNFMIGVTAAAGAGSYLKLGYIQPTVTMPVMLGVLLGSMLGARVLVRAETRILRIVFAVLIGITGIEMIYKAVTGGV